MPTSKDTRVRVDGFLEDHRQRLAFERCPIIDAALRPAGARFLHGVGHVENFAQFDMVEMPEIDEVTACHGVPLFKMKGAP
jgi:hypothetical protein